MPDILITPSSGNIRFSQSTTDNSANISLSGNNLVVSSLSGILALSGLNGVTNNGIPVSTSGHSHISSDITNFNSSVSGLVSGIYAPLSNPAFIGIPTVPTATTGTNTTQAASTAFVRNEISNLVGSAPSTLDTLNELATALGNDANFSTTVTNNLAGKANLSGATFTGSISSPSGNFTQSLLVNGTGVSLVGHTHTTSNISGLNATATELNYLQGVTPGSGVGNKAVVLDMFGGFSIPTVFQAYGVEADYGVYNIGLTVNNIPVSVSGHTHNSSDITDFHSSVSGLLPVTNVIGGTNISVVPSGTSYTVSVSGQLGLTAEEVDDRINNLLIAGTGITLNYDDSNNTLTINTSGLQPSGNYAPLNNPNFSGTLSVSGVPLAEIIDDEVAGLLVAGSGITLNYNDSANTLTVDTNVSTSLVAGTGISLIYNVTTDELSINTSGVSFTGHTHTSSNITDFNSSVSGLLSKTFAVFTAQNNQPPAGSFATLDTRNSTLVLDFDDASVESAVFMGIIPEGISFPSGIQVSIDWTATSATSGDVRWRVEFEKGNTDYDANSFDTATESNGTADATAGIPITTNITATSIDSLSAGDLFRIRISRVGNDATNDTMVGDAELVAIELRRV